MTETARLLRLPDRRRGLGASELAAIAGASPWSTPVSVWLEKVGLGEGPAETPSMRAGLELELPIMRAGQLQAGKRLTHNAQTFGHPDWPVIPLYATPDGFGPGRRCTVEVKLVGRRGADWADGPPDYVALQAQGQLAVVPQAEHAHVIALVGSEVKHYRLERDPSVQAELPRLVSSWWDRHVVAGIAPEANTPGDVWAILRARVATGGRAERLATPDEQERGAALVATLAERDRLDEQADSLRAGLAAHAELADVVGLGWVARWGNRSTIDWQAVARELAGGHPDPELVDEHRRAASTFTFRRTAQEG